MGASGTSWVLCWARCLRRVNAWFRWLSLERRLSSFPSTWSTSGRPQMSALEHSLSRVTDRVGRISDPTGHRYHASRSRLVALKTGNRTSPRPSAVSDFQTHKCRSKTNKNPCPPPPPHGTFAPVPTPTPTSPGFLLRFETIIEALCAHIAAGGLRQRIAGPVIILICQRLRRLAARFARFRRGMESRCRCTKQLERRRRLRDFTK